jgi:hypothetical protein
MRHKLLTSIFGLCLLFLAACGGSTDNSSETRCLEVSLSKTTATVGERLLISGLPNGWKDVKAQLFANEETGDISSLIESVAEGDKTLHYLVTPANPTNLIGGGNVEIEFSNEQNACPKTALTVASLPDPTAPDVKGKFSELVKQQTQDWEQELRDAGIDQQLLKGDLQNLPDIYAPLAVQQILLDHPDNPNSLVNIAATGKVLIDGQEISVDAGALDSILYYLQQAETPSQKLSTAAAGNCPLQDGAIFGYGYPNIQTIDDAIACVESQNQAEFGLSVISAGDYILLGLLAAAIFDIEPVSSTTLKIISTAMLYGKLSLGWKAAIYPPAFLESSIKFTVTPKEFYGVGTTQGQWSDVSIRLEQGKPFNMGEVVAKLIFKIANPKIVQNEKINDFIKKLLGSFVGAVGNFLGEGSSISPIDYYPEKLLDITGSAYSEPTGSSGSFTKIRIDENSDSGGTFELTFEGGCGSEAFSIKTVGRLAGMPKGQQTSEPQELNICPVKIVDLTIVAKKTGKLNEKVTGTVQLQNLGLDVSYTLKNLTGLDSASPMSGSISRNETKSIDLTATCKSSETINGLAEIYFTLPDGTEFNKIPGVNGLEYPVALLLEVNCSGAQEYTGYFEYNLTYSGTSTSPWTLGDCSGPLPNAKEQNTVEQNTVATVTVDFITNGLNRLSPIRVQTGAYTFNDRTSLTRPTGSSNSSRDVSGSNPSLFQPELLSIVIEKNGTVSGAVAIEYSGTFSLSYQSNFCGETSSDTQSGEVKPGLDFLDGRQYKSVVSSDGSVSGSFFETIEDSSQENCDFSTCGNSTVTRSIKWRLVPK